MLDKTADNAALVLLSLLEEIYELAVLCGDLKPLEVSFFMLPEPSSVYIRGIL